MRTTSTTWPCARLDDARDVPDSALQRRRDACAVADGRSDMPVETVAWPHTMLGHR